MSTIGQLTETEYILVAARVEGKQEIGSDC